MSDQFTGYRLQFEDFLKPVFRTVDRRLSTVGFLAGRQNQ